MDKKLSRVVLLISLVLFLSFLSNNAYCLMIESQNVQAMAIYGETSGFGIGLQPNQIVFNVTDPSLIASLISSIEFSVERDCLGMGSLTDAYVYIKFKDGSMEVYDLFGLWSHISKVGLWASCYFVSEEGQTLFENNAQ